MTKRLLNSSYFRKNFLFILLISSIPGIITGAAIYWFGVYKTETELQQLHQQHVNQQASYVNKQFDDLEVNLSHWVFDPLFQKNLHEADFIGDFRMTYDLTQTIFMLQESNPLIDRAYLYVNSFQPILFNPEYNTVMDKQESEQLSALISNQKSIHWAELPNILKAGKKGVKNGLIHRIPNGNQNTKSALILKLNEQQLLQLVKSLTPYDEGAAFLINEEQVIVSDNKIESFIYDQQFATKLHEQGKKEGSFIYDLNGQHFSVSFGVLKRINQEWQYISVTPMSSIVKPILLLSKLVISISAGCLLLSILLTWFATAQLYSPVARLLEVISGNVEGKIGTNPNEFQLFEKRWKELSEKSQSLQSQIIHQTPELRSGFLMQLIQGHLDEYTDVELTERLSQYGWDIRAGVFSVLDIQLTGMDHVKESFLQTGDSMITFVTHNILEEIAGYYFEESQIMNFHDLSFGVIVVDINNFDRRETFEPFAQELTKAINYVLNIQVTVTIGERTKRIKEIPHLYERVKYGKQLRTFSEKNQVIYIDEIEVTDLLRGIEYPSKVEKQLIQAIRLEETVKIEPLLQEFLSELLAKEKKELNIQQAVIQLFNVIQGEIIQAGFHPYEIFSGKNMVTELHQLRDPQKLLHCFLVDIIEPYIERLRAKENSEQRVLVDRVITIMKEKFTEDISLDFYAEEINTTPYTLSKMFKQITGINFIEYLTDIRVEKAKSLLIETDMKISDISEYVGYRNSYFNRIFKKQVGITPSQYRQQQRNEARQKSIVTGNQMKN